MAVIDELAVLLTAQTTQFTQGMGDAGRAVQLFSKTVIGAGNLTENLTFGREQIEKAIGEITNLSRAALKLGTDFESIQKIEFLGKAKGAGIETLTLFFNRLDVKIGEALAGNTAADKSLEHLGVTAKDLAVTPLPERLGKISDAFLAIHSPAQRAAALQENFGRGSRELIPLLSLGSKGIKELSGELEAYGLVNDSDAKAVVEFSQEIAKLNSIFDLLVRKITVELTPALKGSVLLFKTLGDKVGEVLAKIDKFVNKKIETPESKAADAIRNGQSEAAKQIAALSSGFNLSDVTIAPLKARIDEVIGKLKELEHEGKKIDLSAQLKPFTTESERLNKSLGGIGSRIEEAQTNLRGTEINRIKDAARLEEIASTISRLTTKTFFGKSFEDLGLVTKELADLQAEREKLLARQANRDAAGGPIDTQKQKIAELTEESKKLVAQFEALEKKTLAFQEAEKRALKHTDEFLSPTQKLKKELSELREEFELGLLKTDAFRIGVVKASEEFIKSRHSIGAAIGGSKEALSIEAAFLNSAGTLGKTSAFTERIIEQKRLSDEAALSEKIFNAIFHSTSGIQKNLEASVAALVKINASALDQKLPAGPQSVPSRSLFQEAAKDVRDAFKELDDLRDRQRVITRDEVPRFDPDPDHIQRVPTRDQTATEIQSQIAENNLLALSIDRINVALGLEKIAQQSVTAEIEAQNQALDANHRAFAADMAAREEKSAAEHRAFVADLAASKKQFDAEMKAHAAEVGADKQAQDVRDLAFAHEEARQAIRKFEINKAAADAAFGGERITDQTLLATIKAKLDEFEHPSQDVNIKDLPQGRFLDELNRINAALGLSGDLTKVEVTAFEALAQQAIKAADAAKEFAERPLEAPTPTPGVSSSDQMRTFDDQLKEDILQEQKARELEELRQRNNKLFPFEKVQRVPTRDEIIGPPPPMPLPASDAIRGGAELLNEFREQHKTLKEVLQELKLQTKGEKEQAAKKPNIKELSTIP